HRLYRFNFRAEPEKQRERHRWLMQNRTLFFTITALSCCGTLWSLAFYIPWRILPPLLPVALLSVGYTVPCLPWKGRLIRLRDIPGLKIFIISLVLGLTTVLLPMLEQENIHALFHRDVMFVFFRRICFIFAITIPFDIRDQAFDKEHHTQTLPLLLGDRRARILAYTALVAFIILAAIQVISGSDFPPAYFIALLVSALVSGMVIHLSRLNPKDYYYSYLLEGMMLFQCILIFIAHKFWP
ncbi:MAG TPA: UbiA family prenyltransferase, partial [Bacteroidia bacterium]|nr:UbiA family prenyltransferase [Bacteroidia bacterium]